MTAAVTYLRPEQIRPLDVFWPSSISAPPRPREWLVDGMILRKTVALFTGAPGIGKSLLLQQLLTSAAIGKRWVGRHTEQANTYGLFCEDDQDELERRQVAINDNLEIEPPDLEMRFSWRARKNGDARLVGFDRFSDVPSFTPLWHQIWDHAAENGVQLVGLDTAAVVFGGNENVRSQVTAFVTELANKADEINGAVILNAHPSKGSPNAYSGSTAWLASCRFALSIGRPKEYDEESGEPALERVIRGLKANYSGGVIADKLVWEKGVFVADGHPDQDAPKRLDVVAKQDLDNRLVAGLKGVLLNGGCVPADVWAPGSMPRRAKARAPDLAALPLNWLYDAQQRLLDQGRIVRVLVGKKCLIRPADGPAYRGEEPWTPK